MNVIVARSTTLCWVTCITAITDVWPHMTNAAMHLNSVYHVQAKPLKHASITES